MEENPSEAFKYYQLAAEQGYREGLHNLGWCYRFGYGVQQDYGTAVKYYKLATEQGLDQSIT